MANKNAVKNLISYLGSRLDLSDEFYITIEPMLRQDDLKTTLSIAKSGEVCVKAYWIDEGYSRSFIKVMGKNGKEKEVTIDFCKPQKILTIPECFFNGQPCLHDVEIPAGSVIVPFSKDHFLTLKLTAPEAEELANKILALDKMEGLEKMMMLKMPPRERYKEFLRIYGDAIEQFFAQKDIASYLNMQPSYLSRLRGEMIKKGK